MASTHVMLAHQVMVEPQRHQLLLTISHKDIKIVSHPSMKVLTNLLASHHDRCTRTYEGLVTAMQQVYQFP